MTPKVAAILLAAGRSRRMGSCKQLLPMGGKTVIARCLETLLAGGIEEVVVVVSPEGDDVARAARAYPVTVVRTDGGGDMAASVRAGRDALSPEASAAVIALCDYPLIAEATVACLIEGHQRHGGRIIIPCHQGRRGHPPLFPRQVLDGLAEPLTLRDLLHNNPDLVLQRDVSDGGILIDMDTPQDYQRIITVLGTGEGAAGLTGITPNT